jgi:tRNA pseudouridine38-40 synthase
VVTEQPDRGACADVPLRGREPLGVLLTVAYEGTRFAGFAPQPGQRTVSGVLRDAIATLDPAVSRLRGASRTDAGVHARAQRVAFDTTSGIPPRGWVRGLAQGLPDDLAVRAAAIVPPGFDPRFEATRKAYRYLVLCAPVPDPFWANRAWRIRGLDPELALEPLGRELEAARGQHCFRAFRSAQDRRTATERTIHRVAVSRVESTMGMLALDVVGDGFLHHMVRILVGTSVDVARGRLAPGATARALGSGDRRDAGITAPAEGLYLHQIELRSAGTDAWPSDGTGARAQ